MSFIVYKDFDNKNKIEDEDEKFNELLDNKDNKTILNIFDNINLKNVNFIHYLKSEYDYYYDEDEDDEDYEDDENLQEIIKDLQNDYNKEILDIVVKNYDVLITKHFNKLKKLIINYESELEGYCVYINNSNVEEIYCKTDIKFLSYPTNLKKLITINYNDYIKKLKINNLILHTYEACYDDIQELNIDMNTLKSFTFFVDDIYMYGDITINTPLDTLYIWGTDNDIIINKPIKKVIIIKCNKLIINNKVNQLSYRYINEIENNKNYNIKKNEIKRIPKYFKDIVMSYDRYEDTLNRIKNEFNNNFNE